MRQGIGLGVGINRSNYAQGIFNAYSARVVADGGVVESGGCVDAVSSLLQTASLLLIPSGYKGGKAYAEIPTNGNGDLTWTRGSDAFRTNASGLIQRVPWNLLQQSETFSNAYWTKSNTTISADTTTAPNGTLTADTLIEDTTNSTHRIFNNSAVTVSNTIATTYSVYLKSAGRTRAWVRDNDLLGALFNLSTGTIVSTDSGVNATITNVGDSWYRCTITKVSSSVSGRIVIYLDNGTSDTYTGNGTSGIFIWGAQLVEGTTAQTYLPTTDRLGFPRLDYTYGSCPSALLEPQRTNLALWSEDITSAVWLKVQLNTTANTTTSPDGTTNADTIAANGTNNDHTLYNLYTTTAGTAYTFSCYLKANTGRYVLLRIMTTGGTFRYGITFDLQTGTITQTSTTATAPSGTSNTITNVGNGWYRISLTLTASGTQSGVIVATSNSATPTLNANLDYVYTGSESYYLYGMQLEVGAYPTTYIPTTSATATRVADTATVTGVSSLIGQSAGTIYVQFSGRSTGTNSRVITITGGSKEFLLFYEPSGTGNLGVFSTNTGLFYIDTGGANDKMYKIAFAYEANNYALYVNGVSRSITQSANTFGSLSRIDLNQKENGTEIGLTIVNQLALFQTRLSNSQLATLTTL